MHRDSDRNTATIGRRRLLQLGAASVAATAVGSVASVSAQTGSPGDVIWTYGEDELSCPQAETFGAPLTVVDGSVYAGTTCGHVHAVDAAAGTQVDTFYSNATTSRAPSVVDDIVVIAPNGEEVQAFDLLLEEVRTNKIWETDSGGNVLARASAPTIYDGTVYVTNDDAAPHCYALDLWTGEVEWTFDGESLGEAPTVVEGLVYVCGDGGTLYALDAATGDEEWSYAIGEAFTTAPTVADGTVYVGSGDYHLYAVDAETGDEEWSFDTEGTVAATPTVADGIVYAGGGGQHLYAIDATSGQEQWSFATGGWITSVTVANDTVFVSNQAGLVIAVDVASGDESWRFEDSDEPRLGGLIVVDGVLYFYNDGGIEGELYAVEAGVDGSSDGSRVLLGTTGHHDAWAETASVGERPAETGGNDDGSDGTGGNDDGSDETGGGDDDSSDTSDGGDDSSDGSTGGDDSNGADDDTGDDGMPGPGIAGALASVGGAAYLLARRASGVRSDE